MSVLCIAADKCMDIFSFVLLTINKYYVPHVCEWQKCWCIATSTIIRDTSITNRPLQPHYRITGISLVNWILSGLSWLTPSTLLLTVEFIRYFVWSWVPPGQQEDRRELRPLHLTSTSTHWHSSLSPPPIGWGTSSRATAWALDMSSTRSCGTGVCAPVLGPGLNQIYSTAPDPPPRQLA